MNNFLKKIKSKVSFTNTNIVMLGCLFFISMILLSAFFDVKLALGLIFAFIITLVLFVSIFKLATADKKIFLLFLIVFLIHLFAVIFIYYTGFRPSGGGADFENYHRNAVEVAQRFKVGNFSLEGIYSTHYYPVLIGIIYAFTSSEMIIGQIFSAWLSALSVLLAYFLVLEIGGSKKSAFIAGLLISIYPSYLYFGSLLLKDTLVVPLVLLGIILAIQIMKSFDGLKFLLFFSILTALIHLRFYVGFALMLSFIVSWFLLSNLKFSERFIYGLAIIALLGFSPQLAGFKNYYGADLFNHYLNKNTVKNYREVIYAPPVTTEVSEIKGGKSQNTESVESKSGEGSSFVVPSGIDNPITFAINYTISFIYSLFGPFTWQLKYLRHLYFLADTIPFYVLLVSFLLWAFKTIKNNSFVKFIVSYRFCLPLILFSVMAIGALSLLINNFGIIARIRIPMYIVFVCVSALSFENTLNYIKKFKKISNV